MAKNRSIELTTMVAADPRETYRMFTKSTHLREWLADTALAKAHEGGPLYLEWNDGYAALGNYTRLEPEKSIGFTWRGPDDAANTEVEVELRGDASGTEVTVRHSGFAKGSKATRRSLRKAWAGSLENLASVMATGEDLRFTRRPMLGVSLTREVDAERAAELKIPLAHGVELSGVVPGMGAEAVGLRAGDVIVRLAGADVMGWSSLGAALDPHRAGDSVTVTFYRDGIEHNVEMTLSARPLSPVPTTAGDLANYLRSIYAALDSELASLFQGVSEDVAGRKPSDQEWSAKEVVAHLLDGEGDSHSYIVELLQGGERYYDAATGNSDLRVAVTAWSYPAVSDMLPALRHLEEQTVALIEQLPAEFVARKSSFWRLAYGYTQNEDHNREHLDQIRAALSAG